MKRLRVFLLQIRDFLLDLITSSWFSYDTRSKINGLNWRIHQDDADPWPSIPHMHAIEKPFLKLDIYTRTVYDKRTKKRVETVRRKDLQKIWTDEKIFPIIMHNREKHQGDPRLSPIPYYAEGMLNRQINQNDQQAEIKLTEGTAHD